MLCPEVWNFDPPSCSVSTSFCENEEEICQSVRNQFFLHHVSITLPNTLQLPNDLIYAVMEDSQYYRINDVRAAQLLEKDFLELFLKNGNLTAISLNDVSEQNSLFITPCGKFVLSVPQSNFQELGIQDAFVENPKSSMKKYVINLDLTSEDNESRKKCEQVQKKLSSYGNKCFDVVLAWEPKDSNVCPSSIAYYFSKKGHFVKTCDILYKHKVKYNVKVPVFDDDIDVSDLIEWLGAFTLDCDVSEKNLLSTLKCPGNSQPLGQVMLLTFTGLLTHSRVKKIISQLSQYVIKQLPEMWISLSIQSFQNTVPNIKRKNLFFSEGDHHCTVVFKQNHPSLVYIIQDKKS